MAEIKYYKTIKMIKIIFFFRFTYSRFIHIKMQNSYYIIVTECNLDVSSFNKIWAK